ncbi:Mitochondrial ATPase inhibitor, IATP [Plasmodiophora brassicae]|uniref:Uncharacterized protein n=1 Tax=Plasmodiophora brassicae TaxID=37360 RepID=A0A0G4J0R3_PLABS|nr:hypothetical protein PBRA_008213 [Plasmodiophora brassicae]SPR01210.1 unnamed protein product [Plasmodiophora brassicae]
MVMTMSSVMARSVLEAAGRRTALLPSRAMSSDAFKKKDSADEANYFNRQDREAVKKLLAKLHSEEQANQDPLETLFAHHATNLSPALKEDILKWASKK